MKSIQTKFIILILGCVLIASALIGSAGILYSQRVVDENSAKIMNLLCKEKTQQINSLLFHIQQSVQALAVYATKELESTNRLKNDKKYLESYTKKLQTIAINTAVNTEGAMAVYVRFNPDFTPPTSGLFWSKTTLDGNFRQLIPTDLSEYSPSDIEHVGWYYIPIKNGKPTWLNPYLNKNVNIRMISFVIPLYVENQTIGVVGMDIDFKVIMDIVNSMRIYQNGYAFLTDKTAEILYHKEFESEAKIYDTNGTLQLVKSELLNGTSGSSLYSYKWKDEEKKMAFRTLINDMRLAITSPVSEIDSEKYALIMQICFAFLFISILSVIAAIFMTRHLTRPLKELNEAAQKIAAGNLTISITQQTKDEVGMLAESFQQTVEHLQKYVGYINELAYQDALTGVKNKTAFLEAELQLDEKIRKEKPEFAVVVLDLNKLKWVNDNYGHDLGDMLIINACRIICKAFPNSPVFRIGGDEFVVILENIDYFDHQRRIDSLQEEINLFNQAARSETQISLAYGIAIFQPKSDHVFASVFKRADNAMYQNKKALKEKEISEKK